MSGTYQELGTAIGELVDRKNAAYGSSFAKAGDYLRLLYPNGLQPEQYDFALLLVRDFDKSMRIATDQDAFGESPFQDKAGYALLGAQMHKERIKECGSVRVDAGARSTEPNDSAEPDASRPTTPSDESRSSPSSRPPSTEPPDSSSKETDAPAAEQSYRADEVAHAIDLNGRQMCGYQTPTFICHSLGSVPRFIKRGDSAVAFCCEGCLRKFVLRECGFQVVSA